MEYSLESMFSLSGKTIVVTGGSKGIGREIALGCGKIGARIAIIATTKSAVDKTVEELKNQGIEAMGFCSSVSDEVAIEKIAAEINQKMGPIYGLVNSAGINIKEPQVSFNIENFKKVLDVNLVGTMVCCKVFGKYMLEQKLGRIVNISSVRGHQGKELYSAYSASKGGVNTMTKSIAVEWAKTGVNVNAIAPSFTLTDICQDMVNDKPTYDWILSRLYKGRLCDLELLVGPAIFLLSPCSEFITGEILYVDGGWTAG